MKSPPQHHGQIIPVILSGGAGTRLWPLSRALYPKQMMALAGDETLLQAAARRGRDLTGNSPLIVCNHEHRFLVAEQLRTAGLEAASIILEPLPRNTAPAVAVAALQVAHSDPEGALLVLPSDHVIGDAKALAQALERAAEGAAAGRLVTFGITPDRPETGYGYIAQGPALEGADSVYEVARFVEKPDAATARTYLETGGYSWNSGMFLFPVRTLIAELEAHAPEVLAAARDAIDKMTPDLDFHRLPEQAFGEAPSISIDYAVMEKTARAAMVPVDPGWSDLGSWDALWELADKDGDGNAATGEVVVQDVRDSYLRSEGPLLGVIGVEGLVIVATSDAIVVAPKDRAQDIRRLVDAMKADKRQEIDQHVQVHRPWGWYQSTDAGDGFQVKRLCVLPGKRLSLQKHQHRAEHWVVVSGTAHVVNGERTEVLERNQSTYIPAGTLHRLENAGETPLHLIEVQSGSYLGEDDIERFEDDFRRQD